MSETVVSAAAARAGPEAPPHPGAAPPGSPPSLQLVRLPLDRPQHAVAFLRARSRGVMDLIAHFWEGLAQTPPLQRPDLHLVVAALAPQNGVHINISQLVPDALAGAMLYVPKAHRADVLAADAPAAAALAAYICHQGAKLAQSESPPPLSNPPSAAPAPGAVSAPPAENPAAQAEPPVEWGQPVATIAVTDLSGRQPATELIPAELPGKGLTWSNGGGGAGGGGANGGSGGGGQGGGAGATGGPGAGGGTGGWAGDRSERFPIDFITGDAPGIAWLTPLLLPLVHKRVPARQMVNVVMQLPPEIACGPDPRARPARECDIPLLNRWRRLYKEERGIHFDADMDALVQNQRVFVYDLPTAAGAAASANPGGPGGTPGGLVEGAGNGGHGGNANGGHGGGNAVASGVVAVAKIDLDLKELMEIGGVYTFPEHRHHGYGAALMRDLAHRIRQAGKMPTLQVDESNIPALRLYEKNGWRALGRLARVWLTG